MYNRERYREQHTHFFLSPPVADTQNEGLEWAEGFFSTFLHLLSKNCSQRNFVGTNTQSIY